VKNEIRVKELENKIYNTLVEKTHSTTGYHSG